MFLSFPAGGPPHPGWPPPPGNFYSPGTPHLAGVKKNFPRGTHPPPLFIQWGYLKLIKNNHPGFRNPWEFLLLIFYLILFKFPGPGVPAGLGGPSPGK